MPTRRPSSGITAGRRPAAKRLPRAQAARSARAMAARRCKPLVIPRLSFADDG